MQANAIPQLQWCEYAYGSGYKGRESRAMGDSCESGRPTFSLDKCVRPARVGGVVANTKPDSQEASKKKRPKYAIVNKSPHVPLVPLGKASPLVLGRASAGPPGDGWCRTPSGGTQGLGATAAIPLPASLPAASIAGRRWARASDLQNRLFSWQVKGRFLVFHVKLFLKTGFFSPDCFRNLKANAERQFVPPFQDGRKGVKIGRIQIRCSEGVR